MRTKEISTFALDAYSSLTQTLLGVCPVVVLLTDTLYTRTGACIEALQ